MFDGIMKLFILQYYYFLNIDLTELLLHFKKFIFLNIDFNLFVIVSKRINNFQSYC